MAEEKTISLPELFCDVENMSAFYNLKRAIDNTNNVYVTGEEGVPTYGAPDIRWEQIAFIKTENLIYTRGVLYGKAGSNIINDDEISPDLTWSSQKIQNITNNSKSVTPTDIPILYFDGLLPHTKDGGNLKGACHYRSASMNIDCYATLTVQSDSSKTYNKKNFTIEFYSDVYCTVKKNIDFGWGPQSKYVIKANWIDITHSRNIVSARLWGDVIKSRTDYNTLPELLKTSPNYGAVDGFPIKFYGNNVYWGRYSMNIPKDAWMANMDKNNNNHLILCGENYNEALFRAPAVWNGTDWSDELHDEVPAELLARFNQFVSFVMNSTDDEFKANLSDYVDIQSVIDYYVFSLLICNLDGFAKNHIWLSYDGNKFIASAYNMDATFGLYLNGSQILQATYSRTSFEDMLNGNSGNLLYLRLANNFSNEISSTYNRLTVGNNAPMSFSNVIQKFEEFIDIAPSTLVAEDYAPTTGDGVCTSIPSKNINNIQQIRQWYAERLSYVKDSLGVIDYEDNIGLCFTALEAGEIGMTHNGTNETTTKPVLSYSRDGFNWFEWDYSPILVNKGNVICFKGTNKRISVMSNNTSNFTSTGKIAASGNIMSLLYGDDYEGKVNLGGQNFCFYRLFGGCTGLITPPELPATIVPYSGYHFMFEGCTSLVSAPELPATTIASYCYGEMFKNCTSLTTAPKLLPATTLAQTCYAGMFRNCTSLTTAPKLPATTLQNKCYEDMFRDCTNLNYVKAYFTTEPSTNYTKNWLLNVASAGTFVANPSATWPSKITGSEHTVPSGWMIETTSDNIEI